jgi:tRNA threonylcarbamoyl adenosine modification protein (Sua5/YciO/YrdC/YwlC family)
MVNDQDIPLIVTTLKLGRVIILPTDTVYGLACSALDEDAVKQLYEVKGRVGKPGTIIAANIQQLLAMGFDTDEVATASNYWPGSVSVILSAPPRLAYLHMGLESLAVRLPEPKLLQELLARTGPLATTSANLPGQPTVSTVSEAKELFGDKVSLYIDGGDLSNAKASQILRFGDNGVVEQLR